MYEQGNYYLQDWTAGRLFELRKAAAAAHSLRATQGNLASWWTRALSQAGRALVNTGLWLELLANKELAAR